MRLTGDAYAVVDRLSDSDQTNIDKVCDALEKAFGPDPFLSYERFVSRKLHPGESVDVFLADLEKLATSCGIENVLTKKCAFIAGLPKRVRHFLRSNAKLDSLSLESVLERTRTVLADECSGDIFPVMGAVPRVVSRTARTTETRDCFVCGRQGHIARSCPERPSRQTPPSTVSREIVCYRCDERGHIAAICPTRPGNAAGGAPSAPVSSPVPHQQRRSQRFE